MGVDPRTSEAMIVLPDGLFKCRTVRRVIREEAFNPKWMDEAVTPIDEYVQKGATTSFEDVRTHREEPLYHGEPGWLRAISRTMGTPRTAAAMNSSRQESALDKTIQTNAKQGSRRSYQRLKMGRSGSVRAETESTTGWPNPVRRLLTVGIMLQQIKQATWGVER